MPTRERVQAFVETVVAGQFVEALRQFYHDDAVTRENNGPDRRGLAKLVAIEEKVLGAFSMTAHPPGAILVDDDDVAIHWAFDITDQTGATRRMEEIALQRWRGDRIDMERFFYDPSLPMLNDAQ